MSIDAYEFMESQWGFKKAPIPQDAIARPDDPFSRSACALQTDMFERRFILGGIRGGLTYGYLWSIPNPRLMPEGSGTGYGKTALMRSTESEIARDFGQSLLARLNQKNAPKIVAAFTSLDNEDTRGLYAILFSAVERWADGQPAQHHHWREQCLHGDLHQLRPGRDAHRETVGTDFWRKQP